VEALCGQVYMCLKLSMTISGRSSTVLPMWCNGWVNFRPSAVSTVTTSRHRHRQIYRQGAPVKTITSVLWCCRLGGRKGMRPVNNWVVGCWCGYLGWGADLHMAQQMPLPLTISCSRKSRLVLPSWFLPFWYLLTRVVPDKFQKGSETIVCIIYKIIADFFHEMYSKFCYNTTTSTGQDAVWTTDYALQNSNVAILSVRLMSRFESAIKEVNWSSCNQHFTAVNGSLILKISVILHHFQLRCQVLQQQV